MLIYVSYILRFRKYIVENWKKFIESLIMVIFINLVVLSLIAIVRIPINTITIPLLVFITIFALVIYFEKEKKNIVKKIKRTKKEEK